MFLKHFHLKCKNNICGSSMTSTLVFFKVAQELDTHNALSVQNLNGYSFTSFMFSFLTYIEFDRKFLSRLPSS